MREPAGGVEQDSGGRGLEFSERTLDEEGREPAVGGPPVLACFWMLCLRCVRVAGSCRLVSSVGDAKGRKRCK